MCDCAAVPVSSQQETFRAKLSYQARLQQLVSNFAKHTVSDIFAMKMIASVTNLALCIIVNSNLPDNNNNCKNNNKNDNSRKNRLRLFPVPLISRLYLNLKGVRVGSKGNCVISKGIL